MEKRVLSFEMAKTRVEKRDGQGARSGRIVGYAAVFNSDSEDMGFIERIAPGAFREAIQGSDCRVLFNHDPNQIIGRQGVNLTLTEDDTGLMMEVEPVDTPTYRSVLANIEAGLITQQSFGFTVEAEEWQGLESSRPVRTITRIRELFDVSPVTYPAYPDTSVALRSLRAAKGETMAAGGSNEPDPSKQGVSSPMTNEPPTSEEIEKRFEELNDWRRNF